ncbi:hypothetical protein HK099_005870 [Clydaea vesicula]|uniref:C2H2-type domain-containing protein n=1 Tax=Clydaea vesicula TaxID=447962 RepID=A0AAD5XUM3_9FUNG|nr:hypothetical protein HK099_005870 [Clydaea vesicula]
MNSNKNFTYTSVMKNSIQQNSLEVKQDQNLSTQKNGKKSKIVHPYFIQKQLTEQKKKPFNESNLAQNLNSIVSNQYELKNFALEPSSIGMTRPEGSHINPTPYRSVMNNDTNLQNYPSSHLQQHPPYQLPKPSLLIPTTSPKSPSSYSNVTTPSPTQYHAKSKYCTYILESGLQCQNRVSNNNALVGLCYRHFTREPSPQMKPDTPPNRQKTTNHSKTLSTRAATQTTQTNTYSIQTKGAYTCMHPDCANIFPKKYYKFPCLLVSHQKIHSDVKPYTCERCAANFMRLHDLNRHVRNMHQYLKCNHCDIVLQKFEMRSHLKFAHNIKQFGNNQF